MITNIYKHICSGANYAHPTHKVQVPTIVGFTRMNAKKKKKTLNETGSMCKISTQNIILIPSSMALKFNGTKSIFFFFSFKLMIRNSQMTATIG